VSAPVSSYELPHWPEAEPPWHVIVVGGGPAGSSAATHLARAGRRVLLLERERFPREHIGESLLPGVLPHLDALGVREAVERAGFERKEGQTFIWGRDRTPWELDFRELDVHPYSFFVDRARFDEILLRHAATCGVAVRESCTVRRVLFDRGRASGVEYRDADGRSHTERASFVIDASGQSALVARAAGLRRHVRGLKNVALWAYWDGAERLERHQRSHILTVSIPEGWVWCIPLGEQMSVGVVTSSATRAERERMGVSAWYEKTVRECEPAWALLARATRSGDVTGAKDWSYRARRLSGPGVLLTGDSGCFIDPILSTGVHLAMGAAHWAAACVHSSLDRPRLEPFFRRFYEESYETTYRELLTQVKAFYHSEVRRDSVYWTSKKLLRLGDTVRPDRAFLFVTAGLLRNSATTTPHEPATQARVELGAGNVEPIATHGDAAMEIDGAPPKFVWRVGAARSARLVTVRMKGLELSLVEHEPRGILDRPRGEYFLLDLVDPDRLPLALALVETQRAADVPSLRPSRPAGRFRVTLMPYPVREHAREVLSDLEKAIAAAIVSADDGAETPSLVKLRARARRLLRESPLPHGVTIARDTEHRGGGVREPSMTAVFQSRAPDSPLARVYVVVESRLPPELTEMPVVRTRFLDMWVRPSRTRDGLDVAEIPEVRALVAESSRVLWRALTPCGSRGAAFAAAEAALSPPSFSPAGYALLACGRLGDVAT
jgi:flavin-dependent dehydrogenase